MSPAIKRTVWILIAAVLCYTAFIIYSDFRSNLEVLRGFPWLWLPVILGAVLMNFLIRELKWDYFRRQGGVAAPRLGSFLVFFSGFSMAISPGRVGEVIKPFFYKEYFGQRLRRTIPLVFCERLSDMYGLIVLAAVTLAAFSGATGSGGSGVSRETIYTFLAICVAANAIALVLIRNKRFVYGTAALLARVRALRRPLHHLRRLYFATYPLLTLKNLLLTTAMGAVSWFFECVALLMILHGVGVDHVTLAQSTFLFCAATLFGGFLFFLPGGLGGFEASMAVMLSLLGVTGSQAVTSIFLIRVCTLFFSVGLGFLFILVTAHRYGRSVAWRALEDAGVVSEEEIDREILEETGAPPPDSAAD